MIFLPLGSDDKRFPSEIFLIIRGKPFSVFFRIVRSKIKIKSPLSGFSMKYQLPISRLSPRYFIFLKYAFSILGDRINFELNVILPSGKYIFGCLFFRILPKPQVLSAILRCNLLNRGVEMIIV